MWCLLLTHSLDPSHSPPPPSSDGARPSECAGTTSIEAITAMSVSISCVLLFALLGVPCISASLVRLASLLPPVKKARACGGGAEKAEANLNPNGDLVGRGAGVAASLVSAHAPLSEAKGSVDAATLLGILTRSSSMVTSSNPMAHRDPLGGQGRHFEGGAIEMVESVSKAVSGREQHEHAPTSSTEDRVIESRDARTIERECIIALIAEHRESEIAGEGGPDATTMRNLCRKQKKTKKKQTTKKKTAWAALGVGFLRKALAGTVLILHPLVANAAFRAVHCVRLPSLEGGGEFVLATDYSKLCFSGEHLPVFILAIATILVCIVGFPIGAVLALGRSIGCCSARAKDDAEVDTSTAIGGNRWAGPVSGGLCCRCASVVSSLARLRAAVEAKHDAGSASKLAKFEAWSSFTHAEYAPEFFFLRFFFFASITVLSFCNTFLNPDYLVDSDQAGVDAMQVVRFACCAAALVVPTGLLVALLPYKRTARWKLPVRIAILLVSLGMLALNGFAWAVRRDKELHGAPLRTLSYVVLAMSCVMLALLAVCFVFFVVFRGAQVESAGAAAHQRAAREDAVVAASRAYVMRRKVLRALHDWRAHAATAARERLAPTFSGADADAGVTVAEWGSAGAAGGVAATFAAARGARRRGDFAAARSARATISAHIRESIVGFRKKLHGFRNLGDVREESVGAALPMGWEALRDERGNAYYFCAATGETAWDIPTAPGGGGVEDGALFPAARWTSHVDDAGNTYYHDESTDVTAWELPAGATARPASPTPAAPREERGSSEAAPVVRQRLERGEQHGAGAAGSVRPGQHGAGAAGSVRQGARRGADGEHRRVPSKFVRWKFVEREHASLADALLGSMEGGAGRDATPAYLDHILEEIFNIADRSATGSLTTLELMTMLKKRAKGTALDGDAHAIFTLKTLLAEQAEHGGIGRAEFRSGMVKALRKEPNGAPAQWILNELQDAAEQWARRGDGSWARTLPSGRVVDRSDAQPAIVYELALVGARLGTSSAMGRAPSPAGSVSAHV